LGNYEIHTNDPKRPVLQFTILGDVKPIPDYIRRIENANIMRGEQVGGFAIWPTAHPTVAIARAERLSILLRIRSLDSVEPELQLGPGAPDGLKLSRDASGYWLEVLIEGSGKTETKAIPIQVKGGSPGAESFSLQLTIRDLKNLVVTPAVLNLGDILLTDLKGGAVQIGRLGVRKEVGRLRVKSVTSTLNFISTETLTIVDGSNYLIRLAIKSAAALKAGTYSGVVRVETDDVEHPWLEVPCRLTLINR
jgi:hypothetical protein